MTTDQTTPHSREAEEGTLGSVLINPDAYYDIASILKADDFHIHRHGWIWAAFVRLTEKKIPIDPLTVSEELERQGQLAEIGGPAYLTALVNQVPSSLNAEAYAHIVSSHATRRRMIKAANEIARLAYDEKQDVGDATEQAVKALEGVAIRTSGQPLVPLSISLSETYDRVDRSSRTVELPGVPSGLHELDLLLGNFQSENVYVVAARPGQGKTSLEASVMLNAARQGKRVAFFSLEMSIEKITNRLLAQETGINVQLLDTGKLDEGQWPVFTSAVERMERLPIHLDDTPAISPLHILAKCRHLLLSSGHLDLLMIDYLQLMKPGAGAENRTQEIGLITRALKTLAKELHVPLVVAAQLNREVEKRSDKRPQLSDLRESGDIEADADVVIFLHQSDPDIKSNELPIDLIVAKHRNGPTGTVPVIFNKTITRFQNAGIPNEKNGRKA